MAPLSLDEQIDRMRKRWPGFRVVVTGDWGVCWEGEVTSFWKRYTVRIWYVPTGRIGNCWFQTSQPDVYVVSERLQYFDWKGGQVLPHFNMRIGTPSLCCYDAEKDDWDPSRAVADTIVFYAADWLRTYELWRVTGKWSGPESARMTMDMLGRETTPSVRNSNHGQRGHEQHAGHSFRGPKMPTSASFLLMGAASRGFYPQLSWQDLSDFFHPVAPLSNILTSSPAPPLAA